MCVVIGQVKTIGNGMLCANKLPLVGCEGDLLMAGISCILVSLCFGLFWPKLSVQFILAL
jgi:hypothetical protein